jgi:hypothetical protein
MDKTTKNQLLNELENLTRTMEIPVIRQKDANWLLDNAGVNNQDHKNLEKVVRICKFILKEEENV